MPSAGILVAALGLGALLLAGGSKKSQAAPATSRPLDANMPPDLDAKFKLALATATDPAMLDQLASVADTSGFANTAAAFRARAAQLRGQIAIPAVSVPPTTPVSPPPGFPAIPGLPAVPVMSQPTTAFPPIPEIPGIPPIPGVVPPPPAPTPIENLDPNLPPALAQAIAVLLAKADWNDQEIQAADALANTLEKSGFPIAAAKLRAKAMAIRALHAGAGLLGTITDILSKPPAQLPPIPSTPLPGTPPIVTTPPVSQPGVPPTTAPLAKTYKVVSGDNPSKIAQRFTGNAAPSGVHQLAAANPDKSARILTGTIYTGEILTLPDAWPAKPQFTPSAAPPPAASPLAGPHATIQKGSTGPDVVLWQKILGITADGIFGPNTDISTRTWQIQYGLPADGVVGPKTWAAAQGAAGLPSAAPVAPPVAPVPVATTPTAAPIATATLLGPHPTIQQGSTGPDVALWQKIVGVAQDGKFGPNTAAATKTWQSQRGLTSDGVVGPKTWAAAQGIAVASAVSPVPAAPLATPIPVAATPPAASPPSSTTTHATIRQGSSGPDVVLWQKIIGVAPDGQFGPNTAAATKTWQSQRGLTADGIVGPKTWAAALSSASAGVGPTYHVQPSDTPFTIAHRFTGDGRRMFELAEVNPDAAAHIRNGIVFQGQVLNLPATWHVGAPSDASSTSALAGVLEIIGAIHGRPTAASSHHGGA
jgi:peptidoglycan hydrolase-like protein with peptidoglycan-binding domain